MALEQEIMSRIKLAMKEKKQGELRALRAIKSAILLAKTEKGGADELTEEQESKLLQKLAKQRKDSISIFEEQNRADLAATEKEELAVIEEFLPELLSEDEIVAQVKTMISNLGATSMKDMGKVMGLANKELAGKADMGMVSAKVKEALSK